MRHVTKTLITAAALLSATALSGCATPGNAALPGAPSAADVDAGRVVYDRLLLAIEGTPEDRAIAEELVHVKIQNAFAVCMADHGWDYQPIAWTGGVDHVPGPPGDLTAWAPIADSFGTADLKRAVAAGTASDDPGQYATLDEDGKKAWADDMNNDCMSAPDPNVYNENFPASYYTISSEFTDVLTTIQLSEGAQQGLAEWASCMKDHDIDVTTPHPGYGGDQLWPGFRNVVDSKYDSEPFDVAEAFEHTAAAADATCRTPVHDYVLGTGKQMLTDFETEHADELAKVAGEWQAIRSQADQLL